jgi:hypothetical protein
LPPEVTQKKQQQIEGYRWMPDSLLFRVQKVAVEVSEFDLPGPTEHKVT